MRLKYHPVPYQNCDGEIIINLSLAEAISLFEELEQAEQVINTLRTRLSADLYYASDSRKLANKLREILEI